MLPSIASTVSAPGSSAVKCEQRDDAKKKCGLPQVIAQLTYPTRPDWRKRFGGHSDLSFRCSFLSSRSASFTSSSFSFPDLTRCIMTNWERPPNIATSSSINLS